MKKQNNIQIINKGNEIMNRKLIQFLFIGLAALLMSCDIPKRAVALEEKLNDIKDGQNALSKKIDNMQRSLDKRIAGIEKSVTNLASNIQKPADKKPADKKNQPPKADPNKVYNIPIGDSFVKGPVDAAVTIIEWSDFQ